MRNVAFEEEQECLECGETIENPDSGRAGQFCSRACYMRRRRAIGVDDEERTCIICHSTFSVNKYEETKTCSRVCTNALISWTKRMNDD